ncbi:Pentatricopeptide repeat-containing protein [Acorus calamus]|uniref:Pentatricopeptide repeat-containing protein n=1 Tax=Acorus calamus TaxID=4465 RepID=A0AAV9FP87_ACOCL|nr:Pentatricopeptide repeat-containing protein [Acorus calamus]
MHYEALAIQDRMAREGIPPDIVTYNSLMHGLCKDGRMREAFRLLEEIKAAAGNRITYTTMIDGCCRSGDIEGAFELRAEMEGKGLVPEVATYNAMLRGLCARGMMKGANELLNEMDERKVEPDSITCNTLINAYGKIGDMATAWRVRNRMLESGLALDGFTYKALIRGFCNAKEFDEAKEVLLDLISAGFTPSYSTYSWIVDGYCDQKNEEAVLGSCTEIRRLCKRGLVDCSWKLYRDMKLKGVTGDSLVYAGMAFAFLGAGKQMAALDMLDEMVNKQMIVTARLYGCLKASYTNENGMLDQLWYHASKKGLIPKHVLKLIRQSKQNTSSGG